MTLQGTASASAARATRWSTMRRASGWGASFDFRTVHGAPGNKSPISRRVFSARWVGDDAVYAERAGKGSPPFTGLTMKDGDPFDAPIFPRVYSAEADHL